MSREYKELSVAEKQDVLRDFVANHIIMLASSLVSSLLELTSPLGDVEWQNVENLFIDTEEEAVDHGYESLEDMRENGGDMREIYEWWFVTRWFGERLKGKNEPVLDSDYGFLWGRTCTGQAIFLDNTIEEIYGDMEAGS